MTDFPLTALVQCVKSWALDTMFPINEVRMKTLTLVALTLLSTPVFADTNIDMDEAIDVSGNFSQPQASASDRLKQIRAKMEKQNEMLVRKQIETLRLKNEIELTKKTQQAFNQMMNNLEEIE